MNAFQTALSAVLPIFLMLALGVALRRSGILDKHTLDRMNTLAFRVLLSTSLYYNIITSDIAEVFNGRLLLFALISQLGVFGISLLVAVPAEKNKKRCGALAHGVFHNCFLLFGTLIGTALCGEGNLGSISLLVAVEVPLQHVLSVVIFELFRENSSFDLRKIFSSVIKNPLVIAALAGFATQLLPFRIPVILRNVIRDVGRCGTPVALIVMGGLFNFGAIRGNLKAIAIGTAGRLLLVPAIMIPISIRMGFQGVAMVGLVCSFIAPCATTSFSLASAMDSDADLTAQLVVSTALFSLLTIFCWIYVLSRMGIL